MPRTQSLPCAGVLCDASAVHRSVGTEPALRGSPAPSPVRS
ncbi:hypothetical protein [Streptomyces sp. NBC_01257]|nr:hypothetical protein [Streptomyces sp. NBC_01257]WRZ65675.1 hypothetical protein OG408_18085 [Streptomyces sp. NBC_01257]